MKEINEEERELLKEEKRRKKIQKQLETESAARRAAIAVVFRDSAQSGVALLKKAVAKWAEIKKAKVFQKGVWSRFFNSIFLSIGRFLKKITDTLVCFAEKKYSIPCFIAFAFLSYIAIAYHCGFSPFHLSAHMSTLHYYLCDYKVGFCSKLLIGAILSLFEDKVPVSQMSVIANTAIVLALLLQAVIAGCLLRSALKNRSLAAVTMGLLFVFNPLVVIENMATPGLLDIYLLLLFLVWLAFVRTPVSLIVTPLFCFLGMTIHYVFALVFLPPMLTLTFYYAVFSEKWSARIRNAFTLTLSSAVSAASFSYFVFFAKNHLRMTSDEFYQYMLSRLVISRWEESINILKMGTPIFKPYFDFYIFGEYDGNYYYQSANNFLSFLKNWAIDNLHAGVLIVDLVLLTGICLVSLLIWSACAVREKGIKRLPYVLFVLQMVVIVPEILLSTDIWRWVATTLISQAAVFSVIYFDKNAAVHPVIDRKRIKPVAAGMWVLCLTAYVVCCLVIA